MKLLLIDGHALAYRSYYAMIRNPLTNEQGDNTSAEFGFARTILSLVEEQKPDALLACFDPVGKTFRHELYPQYKAQRPRMPEDLRSSIDQILLFLDSMGINWLRLDNYEADDLIASAAQQAAAADWDVLVVSGDKDLCQIVSDRIHIMRPASGKKGERILDPQGVAAEFGLQPASLLDYLSLVGDSSDNIPGVAGLGPKTSLKLLEEFGDLEGIYSDLDRVGATGTRKKLAAGEESAFQSRDLIRLVEDLDLGGKPDRWGVGPEDEQLKRSWFTSRGFLSMLAETTSAPEPAAAVEYRAVTTSEELAQMVAKVSAAERVAIDTETTSLDPREGELVGISLAAAPGEGWYVPIKRGSDPGTLGLEPETCGFTVEEIGTALKPILTSETIVKVLHNLKFDAAFLERVGISLAPPLYDTMLASYCASAARRSHGLDNLARELLNHEMVPYADLFETGDKVKDIRQVPLEKLAHYAAEDADYTLRLATVLDEELAASGTEHIFRDLEMPLVKVLQGMEGVGIALDLPHMAELERRFEGEKRRCAEEITAIAGREFTIGSPKQLSEVLFTELKLPTGKRTKTGYSTDEEVLSELAVEHPIAGLVLEWRELAKLKSTYVDVLPKMADPETGRVHTRFNQAVAATGRLSSSDPNLQNIPIRTELGKEIRRAFIAPPGSQLASFDYSQVELRILAHMSDDRVLQEAFASGQDIHTWTAARIKHKGEGEVTPEERSLSKMVNYGVLYGMGAGGLSRRLRIPRGEAQSFIDEYFASFPGIKSWMDTILQEARTRGYTTTLHGRCRQLPGIDSPNGRIRSGAERVAINTPIQGTAADVIKLAMLEVSAMLEERKLKSKMLLQVHDELLFEVVAGELDRLSEAVVEIMENVVELKVKLTVDWGVGNNWLEAH